MIDPISFLARKIAIHRHKSSVPTGMKPLADIHRVTLLVDGTDPDSDAIRGLARSFFSSHGIIMNTIFLQKADLNWHGWLKHRDGTNPDLFISLVVAESFAADYAARCSTASFKVGRRQIKGDVFDIVVVDPDGYLFPLQTKAFETIAELLLKVG